jgi:hypothetical protein
MMAVRRRVLEATKAAGIKGRAFTKRAEPW